MAEDGMEAVEVVATAVEGLRVDSAQSSEAVLVAVLVPPDC